MSHSIIKAPPVLITAVLLVIVFAAPAAAQDVSAVERQVEALRAQLADAAEKEAQLRQRASQLEEDLRPENVQRSVAGIGTTDAEELRARRREQLERQQAQVNEQLASLAASRTRLEAAIITAEAEVIKLKAAALAPRGAAPPATQAATEEAAPTAVTRRQAPARAKKRTRQSGPRRRQRRP